MSDLAEAPIARSRSRSRGLWRHTSARIGLVLLGLYLVVTVFGPLLLSGTPSSDPSYQNLGQALLPPSAEHPLGTDQLGRDELARLVLGARYTIFIGLGAVLTGLLFGVPLGAVSGFYRGKVDLIVQRFIDILLAFPSFLLALALVAVLGPSVRNLIIAVALNSFPRFVRLMRASAMATAELPLVEAAQALGLARHRILWRHVAPNSMTPIIVQAPLELGSAILTAAGLGFLGLGVQQPQPEWGAMLGAARDLIFSHPRLVTYPGLAIVGIILGFNLLGDGLRDVLDPRAQLRGTGKAGGV